MWMLDSSSRDIDTRPASLALLFGTCLTRKISLPAYLPLESPKVELPRKRSDLGTVEIARGHSVHEPLLVDDTKGSIMR